MSTAVAPSVRQGRVLRVEGFERFGGRHCETSAVGKVLAHAGAAYTEEFLFGMAGGIGFVFWKQGDATVPFVGGRNGKFPEYVESLGSALGHKITVMQTSSERRAHAALMAELEKSHPVVCYGDIRYLPYFHTNRHFGGHAFVVYAIDEIQDTVWISDRGEFPRRVTLADLARARSSDTSTFRPKHGHLGIEVNRAAEISSGNVQRAIGRSYEAMCEPPIANFGLAGIEKFGKWLRRAIQDLPAMALAELLVSLYVNLELAGTGGCAFRTMYRQFLVEAKEFLAGEAIDEAIDRLDRSIAGWSSFIDGLLPAAGPASLELKQQLQAKERVFEKAPMENVHVAGQHARRIGELIPHAAEELAAARAELADNTRATEQIVRWESAAFEALRGIRAGQHS